MQAVIQLRHREKAILTRLGGPHDPDDIGGAEELAAFGLAGRRTLGRAVYLKSVMRRN